MIRRGRGSIAAAMLTAAMLAGAAGVAADAAGAHAAQAVRSDLRYTCGFPSGTYQIGVAVTARFTATAQAGRALPPISAQLTARLPGAALAGLSKSGARSVTGSAVLTALRTVHPAGQPPRTAQPVRWPVSTASAAAIPASGPLTLATAGTFAGGTARARGLVTFTPGSLVIMLAPRRADGAAAETSQVRVDCALASGASTRLAAITVTAASPSPSPSPGRPGKPAKNSPAGKSRFPVGCGDIKVIGTGTATCGYITGFADVAKLVGAALLQPARGKPGLVNVDFAERHAFKKGDLIEHSTGELLYRGHHELPPVTATFLAFRFVPVTATLHLTELTSITIMSTSGITAPPYPITVKGTTTVSVHVTNVKVNGVPLNVGPRCHTTAPLRLVLIGRGNNTLPPTGYTVPTGGPLSGKVTIPPFTGCGVTENFDPLLTGSISGGGNFVEATQGKLCGPSQPSNWVCPPPVPKPDR